jgi:gliding motility-associated-like protein
MQTPQSLPSCGGNQLFVTFGENIKCNTVSAADFTLNGPGGPYTISNQIGSACAGGAPFENSFVLGFSPALNSTGVYTLCLNAAAAGSVLDACNNPAASSCFTFAITVPSVTAVPAIPNCNGAATGSIAASGSGSASFTYQLNNGASQASGNFTGLAAGTYTVKTIGASGCSASTVVTIASPPALTVTPASAPTCSAVSSGSASSVVSGGTPGYTYSWSPTGGTGSTATGLAAGTYTLKVTDSKGCILTNTTTVAANPLPAATLSFTNPTCGNNNGQIFINNTSCCAQTISSFASSLGAISGQTVTGLGAGTPVITLTNSFGCTFTVSATLTMSPGPTNITLVPTNATCGNSNGSFTFGTPVGGTPTYSYAINGGAFSATSPTTGLAPATYSVTIKDANGCVFTKTTSIVNVPGPTALAGTPGPASCAGATGTYTVTGVTGGTPTYSYSVDGGAFAATSTFSGLAAGTHSITVKDANGCTFPTTFVVGLTAGITSATVNASTASCGTSNGTATVSAVTGGVPTYSYSYDGGGFTTLATTSGLAAGPHTVIIKDVNTCTLSVPYTVISLGSPTTSIASFSNVTCFGLSNGSCTVAIPTGGAGAPFTYTLTSPTQIAGPTVGTGQFSGLPVGTYNISVKDAAGCIATTSVVITEPTQVVITPSSLPALCNAAASGTINVVGSGGTPGYTYNLNNGAYQASTVFANQSAGTYNMGIKDANGCTATQSVVVTQPTALAITVASQNANCTSANGIGSATVTGGTGPLYTYTWTPTGGASSVSNGVVSGNYTVTATDANGCVIASPVTIGLTPGGTSAITASSNVTCNGLCNGSLTSGMTGGSAPFTYSWSPGGQTTQTAINLCPGTYTCITTDNFGCKATAVGTITQPPVLTAIMNSNNVKCFGTATGTVSASGSGGTGPYTYLWPTLASTLSTVPNVAIGNYTCNITDANNCTITGSITVTQPSSITLTSSVTAANCGQANGSASITISGGTAAYTQTWSAGSTTTVQGSVVANTYTVQVQDANNCIQALAVTIPNTAGPTISITSQTNVTCFGLCNGVATTSVTGGVTPYNYSWSNGQVTPSGTNLCAGLYTVSATDAAGCVTSTSVNISQPTALTVTIAPTNPKCFGATNGFGVAAAFGGTPTYTYSWGPAGNAATSNQIGAGSYGLSVTDGNGCVVTSSMTLTNPPAMAASITSTNVTCFNACNGIAIATTTNAIGAVSYVWTGGASPVMSQTLTGACAGNYTILATDQNSCTANAQIIITQPTQVTANITSTGSVTCFGGNNGFAVVTPGGGTGPFTYTWTPSGGNGSTASTLTAGSYVATVADANGCSATATATIIEPAAFTTNLTTTNVKCNAACDGTGNIAYAGGVGIPTFLWQPGLQTGASVNNLCAGSQTVTITSNGSCTNVLTFTLTEPGALTAVASATTSNCGQANGRVCVVVTGGTTPYTSAWSNGATTLCNNGLLAGAYTYSCTDFNGCVITASGLVNDIAAPVVSVTSQTNINCFGGSNGGATTSVSGGVTPYGFQWSGTPTFTTQNVPTGFNVGIKNITVTDAAGCVGTASVDITQPTQLVSAIGSFTNVTCFGLNNGGATMLVNGGTAPYNYTWTPSAQTSSVLINVGANTYTGNVSDANGCLTSQQVTISQPAALVMSASSFTNVSCFGQSNGQISTTVQGGTQVYTYSWTPTQSPAGGFISGLVAGNYALSVKDGSNCAISANFTISEPSALTSNSVSLPATCGQPNGSATVTIGGGTPAYNIVWNVPGTPTGSVVTGLSSGTWVANCTDANGCSIAQSVVVVAPPLPAFTSSVVVPPTCVGLQNGTVTVNYTSGTAPYTVNWSNPISQSINTSALTCSVQAVAAGLYSVTLVDSYGCTTTMPVNVSPPNPFSIVSSPNITICYGQSTQISATATGGMPGYTYAWTPNTLVGGGPHLVNPTTTSSYMVSATDANGCITMQKTITIAVTPQLVINGQQFIRCEGENVTLSPNIISGGKGGPYDFAWSNGATTFNAMSSAITVPAVLPSPNQYTVSIDDGCTIMNPPAIAVFTVVVNPNPVIDFGVPAVGCAPLTPTLTGTSTGTGNTFTWLGDGKDVLGQVNPFSPVFTVPGKYSISLVVTTPNGCTDTLTKPDFIEVYSQPIASFYAVPPLASILDPNFDFVNTSQGANSYYWDFGDPAALNGSNTSTVVNPSHAYSYVGEYKVNLVAISSNGCRDIASQLVEITPDFALYIPNTFTPDGNGLNDMFQPMGVGIDEENYRMDIFDRWGENIFTSNSFRKGWDGTVKGGSKLAPQGVYTYKLLVHDIQGNKHPYVGHVTVIRQNQ